MQKFRTREPIEPALGPRDLSLASNQTRASMAGPRVISRKRRDGGYFVTLKNETIVIASVGCCDQWNGSPYISIALSRKKSIVQATPIPKSNLRRRAASI